jgi:hypothetical protein
MGGIIISPSFKGQLELKPQKFRPFVEVSHISPLWPHRDIGAKSFQLRSWSQFCELEGVEGNLEHRQPGSFGRTAWLKKIFWKNFFENFLELSPPMAP